MSDDTGKAEPPLPCPFCGERRTNICATYYEPEDREAFAVTCLTRDCHGAIFQLGYGLFNTREKAVVAWNTRAASAQCDKQSVKEATIEECAKVCDLHAQWADDRAREDEAPESTHNQLFATIGNTANDCAELIRALSETKPAQGDSGMTAEKAEAADDFNGIGWREYMRGIENGNIDPTGVRLRAVCKIARENLDAAEVALRDIISIAKDAQATDALRDIIKRAEEALVP